MLRNVIGDTPESRILDFLLLHPQSGHTLAKIIKGTNLNFRTAQRRIGNLVKIGVVAMVHEDKKSKFYMINMDHLIDELEKMADIWRKY